MRITEVYDKISFEFEELHKQVEELKNSSVESCSEKDLEETSQLLVNVGVLVFEERRLSWDLTREYQKAVNTAALQFSYGKLKEEIKENIFALNQLSASLQERCRAIRAILYRAANPI